MALTPLLEAKELWFDPAELIDAWNNMPDKLDREKVIASLIPDDAKRIVDLGCGNGRMAKFFDPSVYIGYDSSLAMIGDAKDRNDNYTFSFVDIFKYQSSINSDVAIIQDVVQHIEDPIDAIKTIMHLWSSKQYIFTILVGPQPEGLGNSNVIGIGQLQEFLSSLNGAHAVSLKVEQLDGRDFEWGLLEITKK